MQKSDVDNASDVARLLFELTQEEGDSVEICYANPDFGGPASRIYVTTGFGQPDEYFGESVLDCLRQARARRRGEVACFFCGEKLCGNQCVSEFMG